MNTKILVMVLLLWGVMNIQADVIVMSNNQVITGNIIQTNGDDVLILAPTAAFNFPQKSIKGVISEAKTKSFGKDRLPDFQSLVLFLSKQAWATNLSPIPATVIDKGVLRNVPYSSFRCGTDYEVNIYGDLEKPAGIEIGVYHKLLDDVIAKRNCVNFIKNQLTKSADMELLEGLDFDKDLKVSGDLTFEITPPTAEDAYNGWWISVYSEKLLSQARASDAEMDLISMTKADAEKQSNGSTNFASWSAAELKQARPTTKSIISFVNSSGVLITNAEVVRVIDGVSLIWRNGPTSGGMVRLADLPEEIRTQFGYDEEKTKAADRLAKAQKERWQQQVQMAQAATPQLDPAAYAYDDHSDGNYGGGRVYVHGYYRSNGSYVHSYTRSAPHR